MLNNNLFTLADSIFAYMKNLVEIRDCVSRNKDSRLREGCFQFVFLDKKGVEFQKSNPLFGKKEAKDYFEKIIGLFGNDFNVIDMTKNKNFK